ncbi:phosphatase 2C-like domain-containing protein [Mycena epipterygia]|nr:phosphatase 2C-like domain-containing protein [Mycena epipterygia]
MDDLEQLHECSSVIYEAHVLSFQPSSSRYPNEDRYFVEEWPLSSGRWKMLAVFDGHGGGTEAVDFVLATLPNTIKSALSSLRDSDISDARLEALLKQCIHDVDMRIQTDFVGLFSGKIADLSQETIRATIRDPDSAQGDSRLEVLRARTGTTAVIALIDPKKSIHVASLGDCDAVLATKKEAGWQTEILSVRHNCANEAEVERIRVEHPDESGCVNTETLRTLGLIAVTRALGDTLFKLPSVYIEVMALSRPPMHPNYDLKGLAARNITPPYLSNVAEVRHLTFPHPDAPAPDSRLLILASDGLASIISKTKGVQELSKAASLWCSAAVPRKTGNMAADVLRDAVQGGDRQYRGRVDDITIIIYPM